MLLSFSFQFFSPLKPVNVVFDFEPNGRPSGEADVEFSSYEEALEAMSKHKKNMGKPFK